MSKNTPFIKLGNDGESAPVLSYNLPESNNYVGTNVISIDVDDDLLNEKTKRTLESNLSKKLNVTKPVAKDKILNYVLRKSASKKKTEITNSTIAIQNPKRTNPEVASQKPKRANPSTANKNIKYIKARFLKMPIERFNGFSKQMQAIKIKPREEKISPKILFYERIQISNYLGNYGAGKVIKTFSLFPGEKTKISIKTYKETLTTEEQSSGSSILDSTSEEATSDFQNSLASESSSKYSDEEVDIMYSDQTHNESESKNESTKSGKGSASVLFGLVKASGGGSSQSKSKSKSIDSEKKTGEWGTRSARDEFARNVSNAISKHASRASSKRDVKINTSTSASNSSEKSKEVLIEREIQNINMSSTLNLVFRQMNQEFVSVTHLTDIQIALYDETGGPYPKYSLHELDSFLDEYFVDDQEKRISVKNNIIRELYYVFNYVDQPKQFIEKKTLEFPIDYIRELSLDLPEKVEFLRVKKDTQDVVLDSEHIKVKGVILDVNKITMRTDGIVVDAFLGKGKAIDDYNIKLQNESVRHLKLNNDKIEQTISLIDYIDEPSEKANILKQTMNNSKIGLTKNPLNNNKN